MIINFLIIAFVLFMIVRTYNKSQAAAEAEEVADPGPSDNDLLKDILAALKK